ncbi:hypothetical protein ERIG_03295 [Escherichia fergusonii B253]|nr:hypothetical protein ERIG_03295 [Escherichia fergusonii B253]
MRGGAHKIDMFFATGVTKFLLVASHPSQYLLSHPPASSPIKKLGGGGFT